MKQVEQALAQLADEMIAFARHSPHAGAQPAAIAVQMLARYRQ